MDELHSNSGKSPEQLYRNWSAMYKLIEALRYNNVNRFLSWEMVIDAYVTTSDVPWPKALVDNGTRIRPYQDSLRMARESLRSTYQFAVENALAW